MQRELKFSLKTLIGFTLFFSFFSCGVPEPSFYASSKGKLDKAYFQKRLAKIKETLKGEGEKKKSLDWYLNGGSIARYAYDLKTSFKLWDIADERINLYESRLLAQKGAQELGSLLTNDLSLPYTPPIYERVYLNFSQALNDLSLNKTRDAHIELNRALERLKYAEYIFKKEIENSKRQNEQEAKERDFKISDKTLLPIERAYSVLNRYKPYRKFENPIVYYLKGILYYEEGDYNNAADMFKVAYALTRKKEPGAKVVASDWFLTQKKGKDRKHHLWVIYLNGLSFEKVEKVFHLPLFIFSDEVIYSGVALPWLKERPKTSKTLYITTGSGTYKTLRLVDMDALVAWEFRKRLPSIVFREILRAAVKTAAQYGAKKLFGGLAQLVVALYQFATTRADTRQWDWLPKEIQIARVDFRPNEPVIIRVPGHRAKVFKFGPSVRDAIIIVRGFKPQDEVLYYAISFKER